MTGDVETSNIFSLLLLPGHAQHWLTIHSTPQYSTLLPIPETNMPN